MSSRDETPTPAALESAALAAIVQQVAADLSLICDRPFEVEHVSTERAAHKRAAGGTVHISFRASFEGPTGHGEGCVMLPLPEAVSLAAFQLGQDDETVRGRRASCEVDRPTKDTLLELCHLVCGSIDAALRPFHAERVQVTSGGCQGVRAGQRPGFGAADGDDLLIGTVRARLGAFESFELVLQLPASLLDGAHLPRRAA